MPTVGPQGVNKITQLLNLRNCCAGMMLGIGLFLQDSQCSFLGGPFQDCICEIASTHPKNTQA